MLKFIYWIVLLLFLNIYLIHSHTTRIIEHHHDHSFKDIIKNYLPIPEDMCINNFFIMSKRKLKYFIGNDFIMNPLLRSFIELSRDSDYEKYKILEKDLKNPYLEIDELHTNKTFFHRTIKKAEVYAEKGGIIGDTISTTLKLSGLASSYSTYEKMQEVCDELTYVNHYSQCTTHRFEGYWCCAIKNYSSGILSCRSYADKEAKVLVEDKSGAFKYICHGIKPEYIIELFILIIMLII